MVAGVGVHSRLAWAWVAASVLLGAPATAEAESRPPAEERRDEFGDLEDPAELRERLTEREDENRLEEPTIFDVGGFPVAVSGQVELTSEWLRDVVLGDDEDDRERLELATEIEAEVFVPLRDDLFFFAQGALIFETLLHAPGGTRATRDTYAERGEAWLYLKEPWGSDFHLEIGRLDFEDDRTWWWDDDLDAVRVGWETDDFEITLAVARELAPRRTGTDRIEPDEERVLRVLGEMSWEWHDDHAVEIFALRQSDRSETERVGRSRPEDRFDEVDASLWWIGPRVMGAWESPRLGLLGYWLDAAWVHGRETRLDGEEDAGSVVIEERIRRRVAGWAVDGGMTWILPLPHDPRITVGYARGSGDSDPEGGRDRAFRQTGLGSNESGFGGVERFGHYGALLDPELSNLEVWTLGVGLSLFESSSLDLVFHDYRQVEESEELRDAEIDLALTGRSRHVGSALDLVLAVEEWDRFELTLAGSVFWSGSAVVGGSGQRTYGAFASFRMAF